MNSVEGEAVKEVFKGVLRDNHVFVCDERAVAFLGERDYGFRDGGCLKLALVEAAYLVYRGFLNVEDGEGKTLSFEDIVRIGSSLEPDFWTVLNVYSDLRNRALNVLVGVDSMELLLNWKKGERVKRYLVRVVKEGSRLGFVKFEEMFRRALESDRELVVAIVDKEGVVSYYLVEGVLREGIPEAEDSDEVQAEQEG